MFTVTVGADPCVRPVCIHMCDRSRGAYVDVHRADAGVRPYCYGSLSTFNFQLETSLHELVDVQCHTE